MTGQITPALVTQIIFGIIGIANVYAMYMANRRAKKNDEHETCHKDLERRLAHLESSSMTEEKYRRVIREELNEFELRLINDGRVEPKNKKRGT